ncbi:MAG: menaquinone biosynthesis protein [Chthoniobacterales bacterium]
MSAPNDLPPVRLGCVQYLNARPLIHGWHGDVIFDHPSVLCRQLAAGQLDAALVSSFEYLRNPVYFAVDEVAIASSGPVYSVILVHRGEIEALREIVLDPASTTSAHLLRCLLSERNVTAQFVSHGEINPVRGRLLIGDQAIRFRKETEERYRFLDLGEEWNRQTALPFVYALWLIHPSCEGKEKIAAALRSLGNNNRARLDEVIAAQPEAKRAFCEFYFRECLRFTFAEEEKKGFRKFAELCARQKLLPLIPPPPPLI